MKYLKDKNSRRRGVAIELAVGMLLIMVAMSTIIVATTMIQIEKQKNSVNNLDNLFTEIEMMEYDQIGIYFEEIVSEKVEELQTNDEEGLINELGYVYLTEEEPSDENIKRPSQIKLEEISDEISLSLEEKLNEKFKTLIKDRELVLDVVFDLKRKYEKDLSDGTKYDHPDKYILERTKDYKYVFTFSLFVNKKMSDGKTYNVFVVENEAEFNQTITIKSTFLKQFKDEPIEKKVTYVIEDNLVSIELKEGYYLSFSGIEGIENIIISTTENDANLSYFTVQQENKENQVDSRISANADSLGQSVTITLNYKKKIVQTEATVENKEATDQNQEQQKEYEDKSLVIKITVVKDYTINNGNQGETVPDEGKTTDINLLVDESTDQLQPDGSNDGSLDVDSGDTKNETQQSIVYDIIITRQEGIEKVYIEGGDIHKEDIYEYKVEIVKNDSQETIKRTHWEYK